MWNKLSRFFTDKLWRINLQEQPKGKSIALFALQLLTALSYEIQKGELKLQAMGLVYTTLLSLAPLLAVSFSVLKAFGVHNQIEPLLLNFLEPLGEKGIELTQNIINFVENINVGVLGSIGLAILIFTVVSVIHKLELAFNSIWRDASSRNILRRFSDYLSVILVGPVLVFTALGTAASIINSDLAQQVLSVEVMGMAYYLVSYFVPYVLIVLAFTFLYAFMPNTKVNLSSAFIGAIVSAFLWKSAGWGFGLFVSHSSNYDAIYSSLAILIFFIIWLFVSWFILLIGAQLTFFCQTPHAMAANFRLTTLGSGINERLGLMTIKIIAQRFNSGLSPISAYKLSNELSVNINTASDILSILEHAKLIANVNTDDSGYILAKASEAIPLTDVLKALRCKPHSSATYQHSIIDPQINTIMSDIDLAIQHALAKQNVASLCSGEKKSTNPLPARLPISTL